MSDASQTDDADETASPGIEDPAGDIARSAYFDAGWYARTYPGAIGPGVEPARHYLEIGALLGRNPGPSFGTAEYLSLHKDVARAGMNPLVHYERYGRPEGRSVPPPETDTTGHAQAEAASRATPRNWRMSPAEARDVFARVRASRAEDGEPRRFLRTFDCLTARRYVAAAMALGGPELAALRASVILPTFDRGPKIERAVRSVLAQSHANLELLVVDDGSTDDTIARLERVGDPRMRILPLAHGGVSAARNAGLSVATGDYVFYLDSDNAWTADHVALMLAGLRATDADCGYAASCLIGSGGVVTGYRGEPFDWEACLARNYVDMNVFAHRRTLAEELGGFDTDLRRTVDWDLILRYTKRHDPVFLPYLGCFYHDDSRDRGRITNSEHKLYRRMVIEKARRGLRTGRQALDSMPLSFGIKIATPAHQREEWGDYHYARSLADALTRRGHAARIDFKGRWSAAETRDDDVALVLHGLSGYTPRRGQATLLWVISHPDRMPYAEYGRFDAIMVASSSYAALLSFILDRRVTPMLQCTDTTRFFPADAASQPPGRGLFVGNSRNEYRQMVRWAVENDLDLDIYGARWTQFIPADRIAAENLPNERLGAAYGRARYVLNDHWASMRDFGFVSNRVFDVLASGGRLVSDHLPALEALFGDAVETVATEAEFLDAVARVPSAAGADMTGHVAAHHSFDARVRGIEDALKDALTAPSIRPNATTGRHHVGLLMERDDAGWSRSAHLRLIAPLTTDHAHQTAGIDLVALDGPDDPRLGECEACIVQNAGIRDAGEARRLAAGLAVRGVPLYVDVDDAFQQPDDSVTQTLMGTAREVWFASETIAERHERWVGGTSRIRPDAIDPRYWHDYRNPAVTSFDDGAVRFVVLATGIAQEDLAPALVALDRIAGERPGWIDVVLVGLDAPFSAPWLRVEVPAHLGYPHLVRFLAREIAADVGLAPGPEAASDVAFLHHGAMGLLPVVADAPAYRASIDAGFALGAGPDADGWYAVLAEIVADRAAFADMRRRSARHVVSERNVLSAPVPLADIVSRRFG